MDIAKDRDGDRTPKRGAKRSEQMPGLWTSQAADGTTRTPATYVTASSAARRPEDNQARTHENRRVSYTQVNRVNKVNSHQPPLSFEDRSQSWPALARSTQFAGFEKRVQSFERRANKAEHTRHQMLLSRSELKYIRDQYRRQLQFVDESHDELRKHMESMVTVEDYHESREETKRLYSLARRDQLGLMDLSARLQDLEDRLSALESEALKQDRKFRYTTEKIFALLRQFDPNRRDVETISEVELTAGTSTEALSASDRTSIRTESSHDPEPLTTYYDKAGDVHVMQDRLLYVENEYVEELADRMRREDQGEEQKETEEAFEERHNIEREDAQRELEEAKKAQEDARFICMNYGMVDPEAPEDASNAEPEAKPSMVVTNNEPDGTGTHPWLALEEMDLPLEVKQLQGLDDESPFVTEAPPSEQTQDPQVSVQQWILDSLGERHEPTLSEMGFIGIHSPRPLLHHRSSLPGMSDPLNQRSYGLQDGLYLRLPPQTHTPNTENFQPLGRSIDSRSRSSSTSKLSSYVMMSARSPDVRPLSEEVRSRVPPFKT